MAQQDDLFKSGELIPAAPPRERVIPFGQYKGQPYEILKQEADYALWLLNSMFAKLQTQHPELLAFLVNRYGLPDRTPAHNTLQNRFLEDDFAIQFGLCVSPKLQGWAAQRLSGIDLKESWTWHVRKTLKSEFERLNSRQWMRSRRETAEPVRDALLAKVDRLDVTAHTGRYDEGSWGSPLTVSHLEFEKDAADVSLELAASAALRVLLTEEEEARAKEDALLNPETIASFITRDSFRIEVKPIVGDDYPAILRAMKAVHVNYLLIGEYTSASTTWEQLVRIFEMSRIVAVRVSDIEQRPVPEGLSQIRITPMDAEEAKAIVLREYAALEGAAA